MSLFLRLGAEGENLESVGDGDMGLWSSRQEREASAPPQTVCSRQRGAFLIHVDVISSVWLPAVYPLWICLGAQVSRNNFACIIGSSECFWVLCILHTYSSTNQI